MTRTNGANKSILFAQIFDPNEVTPREFAQIRDDLFAHVYKALWMHLPELIKHALFAQVLTY